LAAVLTLGLVESARADGCDASQVGDIFSGAWGDVQGCSGVISQPGLLAAASLVGTGLAISGGAGDVCPQITSIIASSPVGTVSSIENALSKLPIGDSLVQELESIAKQSTDPFNDVQNVAKCACAMATSLSQIGSLIGDCLSDALCWFGDQGIGQRCDCGAPTPIIPANCYQLACAELMPPSGFNESQCANVIVKGPPSNGYPVTISTTSLGSLFEQGGPNTGSCAPIDWCYCPQPMTWQWVDYAPESLSNPNAYQMLLCECPVGSSLAQNPPGPGGPVCLCDNGLDAGQPIPLDGCAPVCPQTQVPIAGGGCCDPQQVAACGVCCSDDQIPDPNTGNCMLRPQRPFTPRQ
jgi:hypothetical protein